ncbi:MAG: hypothetical protein P0116_10815 [Candidatus Nitrosocosmicus sp.]|nr:hypothetical protein [Candidatus Nitrosocosmicus sp.]
MFTERISKATNSAAHLNCGCRIRSQIWLQQQVSKNNCCRNTGSNVVSVLEQVVMHILALVRNYIPAYKQVIEGRWDIAEIASKGA